MDIFRRGKRFFVCLFCSFLGFFNLHLTAQHEPLHHSVHGPEDAHGRARYLEERTGTGMSTGFGPRTGVERVCVCASSGEAGGAGSFRLRLPAYRLCGCVRRRAGGGRGHGSEARSREGEELVEKGGFDSLLTLDGAFLCTVPRLLRREEVFHTTDILGLPWRV